MITTAVVPPRSAYRSRSSSAVRTAIGKYTYIGSWLTIVASVPVDGLTTLPMVTLVRPILPAMGEAMSV